MRELEETVRLASSLHAQLKRSVAYFGSSSKNRAEAVLCLFSLPTPSEILLK